MKLGKNISNKPTLLYDGLFSKINNEYKITVHNGILPFNLMDVSKNSLQNLFQNLSEEDKKRVIKEGQLKNELPSYYKNFITEEEYNKLALTAPYFKSEMHLSLNYLIKENFLILFTYGEKQPSRWILVVEGIWEVYEA